MVELNRLATLFKTCFYWPIFYFQLNKKNYVVDGFMWKPNDVEGLSDVWNSVKAKGCEMMCRWNGTGLLLAPFFSFLARLSSLPPPRTTSDEGAGRRIELSRRSRESLAAHLGARRGGAVMRSVRGRRINGVSPPSPSPWVDPLGPPSFFCCFFLWCFQQHSSFSTVLVLQNDIVFTWNHRRYSSFY